LFIRIRDKNMKYRILFLLLFTPCIAAFAQNSRQTVDIYPQTVVHVKDKSAFYSPDGKYFVTGSFNDQVHIWDFNNSSLVKTLGYKESGYPKNYKYFDESVFPVFSPDGTKVATLFRTYPDSFIPKQTEKLVIYNTDTGERIDLNLGLFRTNNRIMCMTFSNDSEILAYFELDEGDERTLDTINILNAHKRGKIFKFFRFGHGKALSMAFSPDDSILAVGTEKGVTLIDWEKANNQVYGYNWVELPSAPVYSIKYTRDGKAIAAADGGNIKIWNTGNNRLLRTLEGRRNADVMSLALSGDDKYIVASFSDKTIMKWDITKEKALLTIENPHVCNSVDIHPNGKYILAGCTDGTIRTWDIVTGKEIATFLSFTGSDGQLISASRDITPEVEKAVSSIDGEWLVITPDGYYAASPRGDRYVNARIGNTVNGIDSFRSVFYNPDVVRARLTGRSDPVSKKAVTIQQAAAFLPPEVSVQTQTRTASSSTANISVSITDKNLPVQNIIVMVNGRRLGKDELSAASGVSGLQPGKASMTVTGSKKTLNFTLPVNIDPGNNRIEVVAFNGYSENRHYVDVNWDAPVGNRPKLPDLYILAIGVNKYDNPGEQLGNLRNLDYCVADARGIIDSLKAQEGLRYGNVHSLLIADDADIKPTAENIRKNLKFLEGAGPKDVALLFLAGHGMSAAGGKFYFLPRDAVITGGNNVTPNRAISGDEIVAVLDAPGNRLVFIDACKSGGVDNDRMVRLFMDTNAFVFAACRGNESSLELPNLGHGVFTYSVMEALKGTAGARAANNVSVKSMSGFVSIDVPERTQNRQHPSAYSLGFYDFPMALIEAKH